MTANPLPTQKPTRNLLERSRHRLDGHPVHGPPAQAGPPLPLPLAPRAWWQGRYRSTRLPVWDAVTSLLPEAGNRPAIAIDIGCGMRPFDKALEARGYRVLAIDLTGNLADVLGTVERLPLASGTASVALCVNVLQYIPKPLEACREIVRVLEPGGRFVVCLPSLHPFDHLDLWRWTGLSAAELLEQAGLTDIGVSTVGTTAGNILHLAALGVRQALPIGRRVMAGFLEIAASRATRSTDRRLPIGYAACGTKPTP